MDEPIDRAPKRADMGTRLVALLAILGGIGLITAFAALVALVLAYPGVDPWWHLMDRASPAQSTALAVGGRLGIGALGAATVGVILLAPDRLSWGAAFCGAMGGGAAIISMFGAAPLAVLLPIGSAIVVGDVARLGLVGRPLAIVFIGSAVAFLFAIVPAMGPSRLDLTVASGLFYPIAWIAFGARLAQGFPGALVVAPGG